MKSAFRYVEICLVAACLFAGLASGQDGNVTTVGMPGRLSDFILPGPQLEPKPIDRESPVVVRIINTIKHGDGHRYEIEYYCLEPGNYNLADYLQLVDGSEPELPPINVTVEAKLGEGQVVPNALKPKSTPRVGGYTIALYAGGVLWGLGLLAILFLGRNKKQLAKQAARGATLAERLRPLVEEARKGELSGPKQAELERMLLTYWREKLDLNNADASEAIVELRNHETAGQLLRQLENWLHMPAERRSDVNVAELLEPYKDVRDPNLSGAVP